MPGDFKYDVFLSHNHADKPQVRRLAEQLKAAGVRVWLDEWIIQAGDIIALKVDEGLEQSRVLLLCISPAALASGWVALERSTAVHRDPANAGRRFIPLLLGECALPDTLRRYKYLDFREESDGAFAEVMAQIQPRKSNKQPEVETSVFAKTTVSAKKPNNIPFPPNPYFRGRGEALSRINDLFASNRTAALTQSLAVSGQGGIGKTQTAIEYGWQYEFRYSALLWVSSESPQLFRSGLASLAGPAALDLGANVGEDMNALIDKVVRWLRQHEDWLLVCDNADTAEAIEAVMAELSPALGGYLLITSRLSELPATIHTEQLDILAPEDAVAFLLHRSGRSDAEQNHAGYVANALGCFPLALEQAAAWVRATSSSWSAYIEKLNRTPRSALGYPSVGGVNYRKTILTTWEINFSELNHLSRQVLRCISLQAGEPIPESLFQHQHAKWDVSGEQLEEALFELAQYCLAKRRNGGISIHRLTQFVVRNSLSSTERTECLSLLLVLFELHCTGDAADARTWRTWDAILPHALSIIDACDHESLHCEELIRLIQNAALFIQSKHRPEDAMPLLALGQTISTRNSPNSIESAKAKNSLGGCLWQLGRTAMSLGETKKSKDYFLKAESLNREAVAIAENLDPADKEFLATALNNLGNSQRDLGLAGEAEQTLRRALEIDIANRGGLHPKVAIRRNNLGQLLMGQKRFTEAEAEFLKALQISETEFGELNPVLVIRYSALGQLKLQIGDYKEAEKFFWKSLEIAEQVLPDENPNRRRAVQQFENICALVRNAASYDSQEPEG